MKASAGRPAVAPACAGQAAVRGSALVRAVALTALMALGPAPAWGATAAPCCGPITADGRMLLRRLDESGVLQRWLPRSSIDWRTGAPVPRDSRHPVLASHCSGFSQHRGAWKPGGGGGPRFYAHAVDWSRASR
jgi:hypothetical protein